MYAVFRSGSKQYRVSEGQMVRLEKLNIAVGAVIEFNQIIMIVNSDNIKIGNPFIDGSKITAKIVVHSRDKKIMIVKFHRRKHFRKHQGHRQWFTDILITSINN